MKLSALMFFCAVFLVQTLPVQAGGGLGLPDLTTQMRNQNAAAVQRFRGAAQSGRAQRQRLRLQRRARENALRETRRKRRKTLEDSGLLVPAQ